MTGVTLDQVIKKYGDTQVIHGIDLDIEDGEFCVFVGPSGCGKSTLLRMVAGLEEPTTGALALNGQAITGPGRDRGMVFQSYTSFPWLTVRQNVAYGLRITGDSSSLREGAVDYFIDAVRLGDVADAYPHELSGGRLMLWITTREMSSGFGRALKLGDGTLRAWSTQWSVRVSMGVFSRAGPAPTRVRPHKGPLAPDVRRFACGAGR